MPPNYMLDNGSTAPDFFNKLEDLDGRRTWVMKTREQYSRDHGKAEMPGKKYFNETKLPPLILNYNQARHGLDELEKERGRCLIATICVIRAINFLCRCSIERQSRHALIDFIQGLLNQDPIRRWTPHQIRNHPFLTGNPFTGPFEPDAVPSFVKRAPVKRPLEPAIDQPPPPMMMGPPLPGPIQGHAPITLRHHEGPPGPVQPPQLNFAPATAASQTMVAVQPPPVLAQGFPRRQRARTVGNSQVPPQMQMILSDIKAYPVEEHKHSKPEIELITSLTEHEAKQTPKSLDVAEGTSKGSAAHTIPQQSFGHRRTRSQGNLAGVLPADSPSMHLQYKRRSIVQQSAMDSSFSTSPSSSDEISLNQKESRPVSGKHTTYGQDGMEGQMQQHHPDSGSGSGSTSRNNSETTSPASSLAAALDRKVKIASKVKVRIGSRDSFRMPADVRRGAPVQENPNTNKGLMRGYSAGEAAGGLLMMRASSAEGGKGSSKSISTSKRKPGSEKTGGMMT